MFHHFKIVELNKAQKKAKNRKTPGIEETNVELIKYGGLSFDSFHNLPSVQCFL